MNKQLSIKIGSIALLVFIFFCILIPGLRKNTLENPLIQTIDHTTEEYLEEHLKKALTVYAITRGINGVISLLQDSEVDLAPAGVGVTIAVGEILDPVNDLIERFSWILLVSASSLGIQRILLEVSSWLGITIVLSFALLVLFISFWRPKLGTMNVTKTGWNLVLAAIIIRIAIPAVAGTSSLVYELFLHPKYIEATQTLADYEKELNEKTMEQQIQGENENKGWLGLMFDKKSADFGKKIQSIKETINKYSDYIINLIVVFVVHTIIIPVVVLWLLIKSFKMICSNNFFLSFEQSLKKTMPSE